VPVIEAQDDGLRVDSSCPSAESRELTTVGRSAWIEDFWIQLPRVDVGVRIDAPATEDGTHEQRFRWPWGEQFWLEEHPGGVLLHMWHRDVQLLQWLIEPQSEVELLEVEAVDDLVAGIVAIAAARHRGTCVGEVEPEITHVSH